MFTVIKRDGKEEQFSQQKIEKVIKFTSTDLNLDLNKFYEQFSFTFKNRISTKEIHKNLISTANQLTIDVETNTVNKDYSIMANRLYLLDIWKTIKLEREKEYNTLTDDFGMFKNSNDWIKLHLEKYVNLGIYDERILKINKDILRSLYNYAKKVNADFEPYQHFLWNNYYYQTLKFYKSYIIKYENKPIETFEEALLLISILGFYPDYNKDKDLFISNVKKFYTYLAKYYYIPATPQLLNLRRKKGNLSSCNILNIYDNLESIYYSLWQVAEIMKNAGGVGVYLHLRPSGSWLLGNPGNSNHIQLWNRLFNDTAVAVNQGGMRKGAITIGLPIYHKDIEGFIQSRNPLGEHRFKLFDIFPQVIINKAFIKRLKENKSWYLIDTYEVKKKLDIDLDELFSEEFENAYNKIEEEIKKGNITNYIEVSPIKLLSSIFKSITSSGLPYITFDHNVNDYSPYYEKIYSLNLCVESFSPFKNTNPEGKKPGDYIKEEEIGYIHSCNLFSLNLPRLYEDNILFDDEKYFEVVYLATRYMDNILDISNPPLKEISKHNKLFRTIGIGYLGFADLLVKLSIDENKLYTFFPTKKSAGDKALYEEYKSRLFDIIKKVFGRTAYFVMKSSINLAKERGKPEGYDRTKYKDLILLGRHKLHWYKYPEDGLDSIVIDELEAKTLPSFFGFKPTDEIIKDMYETFTDLMKYGIRNTMMLNCPPNTSTAIYAGTTASILPVYSLYTKESQQSATYLVFPRYIEYSLFYDIYKNITIEDISDIVDFISKVQEYIDSGISFEYPINVNIIKKENIPEYLLKLFLEAESKGIKALYYGRPITTQGKEDSCESCAN